MIDFFTSQPHYVDHLVAVWWALPAEVRGVWVVPETLVKRLKKNGVRNLVAYTDDKSRIALLKHRENPIAVASFGDLRDARRHPVPIAYFEHGAGQSYLGDGRPHPSYAGAEDRIGVGIFIVPGPAAARPNRERHPQIPCVEVGCPKLDHRHLAKRKPRGEKPVVALAFHWDCRVALETRTAFPDFRSAIPQLAADGRYELLGHAHPRADKEVWKAYRDAGIEVVESLDEIFDRANLLIADNTSAIFEFASLGRPVVLLNAKAYRKHINHGLRFWSAAGVGIQVDTPDELLPAVEEALRDTAKQRAARKAGVAEAYAYTDGHAAERAAAALVEWLATLDQEAAA